MANSGGGQGGQSDHPPLCLWAAGATRDSRAFRLMIGVHDVQVLLKWLCPRSPLGFWSLLFTLPLVFQTVMCCVLRTWFEGGGFAHFLGRSCQSSWRTSTLGERRGDGVEKNLRRPPGYECNSVCHIGVNVCYMR